MIIRIGLFCAGLLGCGNAVAQQSVPRAADGHPDFQGVWESLWLTPLELPDGVPSIHLTDAEAMHVKQMFLEREDRRAKNQLGTQGEIAIATNLLRIDGGYRGSQVVDPPTGKIPFTPQASARLKAVRALADDPDGPESFLRGTRCLTGTGLPPMTTSNFDNMRRIVQTPGYVVIYSESITDTRIIPFASGIAAGLPRSMGGASFARWDGDVLVVETAQFDAQAPSGAAGPLGEEASIVERFWLNGPDELDFRYTVTDPQNLTQAWSGEMAWLRSSQRLYETVCHEANYSLAYMLSAARLSERRAAKPSH